MFGDANTNHQKNSMKLVISPAHLGQIALVLSSAGLLVPGLTRSPEPYDLVITNGWIIDGTGNPAYQADIAIRNGIVAKIGKNVGESKEVVDAAGATLAPGFIDVHTHAENVAELPLAENFVRMGVTTLVVGNCGTSELNLKKWFAERDKKASVNLVSLVGHNSVRSKAMGGNFDREPTPAEMAEMKRLVDQAMRDGAAGFSTGLIYQPGTWSKTEEIIELAKVSAQYGGLYASHMRNEGANILAAIDELISIARSAGCRAQLSHIKLSGENAWGKTAQVIQKIEDARKSGIEVTQDQYAYTASSTTLSTLIPDKYLDGGTEKFRERAKDPAIRKQISDEMKQRLATRGRTDYAYAVISRCAWKPELNGKNVMEAAKILRGNDSLDDQIETVIETLTHGGVTAVFHGINESDVQTFMTHPNTMIASDSGCRDPKEGVPHPRGYGNNVRVLQRYVRELKVLRLEEAIRKMTSLPAQTFRLRDRGQIREGFAADIVMFRLENISEKTTYTQPHQLAEGFDGVWVNGIRVVSKDSHTKATPGVPLRRS